MMKYRWLACGVSLGCGISPVRADVVDDAGVPLEEILKQRWHIPGGSAASTGELLLGIPLSPEHEAELRAGLPALSDPSRQVQWAVLLETRGNYAKVLEVLGGSEADPLDRARLLVRMGREDEARAIFTDSAVAVLEAKPYQAFQQLTRATRPLESAEDWETLGKYLEVLLDRLKSPVWQATVWREQADVAWHRDLLPALLESAAGDKFRLAILHQRMGNVEECEKLLTELTRDVPAARIAELLGLFPSSESLRQTALERWGQPGLAVEDRRVLWPAMNDLDSRFALDFFHKWLRDGGDPAPFADLIRKAWLVSYNDSPQRTACLEILHSRFPEDPSFQFLLGRQVVHIDPDRAAKLFESAAASPLRKNGKSDPKVISEFHALTSLGGAELELDPALLGFFGLSNLNRQDRIKEVLSRHPDWAGLTKVDQARYLALGGMDQDFCELVLAADPALAENEALLKWLVPVLKERSQNRMIPPEVYRLLLEKMNALVLGPETKSANDIPGDANALVGLLVAGPLKPEEVKAAVERLKEAAAKRQGIDMAILDRFITNAVGDREGYQQAFPRADNPELRRSRDLYGAVRALQDRLALLAMPEIERLASDDGARPDRFHGSYRGSMWDDTTIGGLERWVGNFPQFGRPNVRQEDKALGVLMRTFPAGHPRRLLADVMLAEGLLKVGDEPLVAESKALLEELLTGKRKIRGTELFRFLTLSKREDMKGLRELLEEVKQQPPAVREKFIQTAGYRGDRAQTQVGYLVAEILGSPQQITRLQQREKPDDDVVKLEGMRQGGEEVSDEMIEVAGRILEKQLVEALKSRGSSDDGRDHGAGSAYLAVNVFERAGRWKAWREAAKTRMNEAGRSELEVLRFLRIFEAYASSSRNDAEQIATARRIFELDPTDKPAAVALAKVAMESRDRSLLVACIRSLGVEIFGSYQARRLTAVFQNGGHEEFLAALETSSVNGRMRWSREIAETMHGFFLSKGPEFAGRFRKLLSGRNMVNREMRVPLAKQLLEAGQQGAAVEWIAAAYEPVRNYTGQPWAFPPLPGRGGSFSGYRGSSEAPATLRGELDFLREQQLLKPVIGFLDGESQESSAEIVTLRLAAAPEPATFEQHAMPLLERMPASERAQQVRKWYELFSGMSGASSLTLRIAAEELKGPGGSPVAIAGMIRKVAEIPEGRGMIPELWNQLNEQLSKAGEGKGDGVSSQAGSLLPVMLEAADDDTWQSYWKWRSSNPEPLGYAGVLVGARGVATFAKDSRIRDLLPRAFGEFDPSQADAMQWRGWLSLILRSGDAALLRRFRMMVPPDDMEIAALGDLAEGKAEGLSPVAGVRELGGDECSVWWNLATMEGRQEAGAQRTRLIPLAPFSALDGKFDLQILGAKRAGQFSVIRKIEGVRSYGHETLKLAPDIRQVAVMVTERGGAVVRWTPPVDRAAAKGEEADLSEAVLLAKGFERTNLQGPGGIAAYRMRQIGNSALDVAELPWDGGSEISASVWTMGDGRLGLSFLDAKGNSLREMPLTGNGGSSGAWSEAVFRGKSSKEQVPSATERIVLRAGGSGYGQVDLAVSSLILATGEKSALPEGFEKLGRLPGSPFKVALSPDGKRLAIISQEGRAGLIDLATKELKEFSLDDFASGQQRSISYANVLWAGSWLFVAEAGGVLYRIDPATLQKTVQWEGSSQGYGMAAMRVSADGKWLVWMEQGRTLMLMPVEGGETRSIKLKTDGQFAIAPDGVRIRGGYGNAQLLKTADFAGGQPVDVATPDATWEKGWYEEPRVPAKWQGRIQIPATQAYRHRQGEKETVGIPAAADATAAGPDGELIYVDRNGVIVRVTP